MRNFYKTDDFNVGQLNIRSFRAELDISDGDYYDLLVFGPIKGVFTHPSLGSVENGYIISYRGVNYAFQPEGFLSYDYVMEKLGVYDIDVGQCLTDMIRKIIGRETNAF
jgi:hypothetical protein